MVREIPILGTLEGGYQEGGENLSGLRRETFTKEDPYAMPYSDSDIAVLNRVGEPAYDLDRPLARDR